MDQKPRSRLRRWAAEWLALNPELVFCLCLAIILFILWMLL